MALKIGMFAKNGWLGYGVRESFKKPTAPSQWYKGMTTACKAAATTMHAIRNQNVKYGEQPAPQISIVQPAVVFDGDLFEVFLDEDGGICLSRIEMAAVTFNYRSFNYNQGTFYVDLVSMDGLPKYITLCNERVEAIGHAIAASDAV